LIPIGSIRTASAEVLEITISFCRSDRRGLPGQLMAVGSASTQCGLRWLQLCIDQDALAHPSDAGLRPAAAFSPHLSKIAGVLSG
jgi:hypothetical protein